MRSRKSARRRNSISSSPPIQQAAGDLRQNGARVDSVHADLATTYGMDQLLAAIGGRPVTALLGSAGRGLGKSFLDQDFPDVRRFVDTNVTGTLYLLPKVGREMQIRDSGHFLITGSVTKFMPGTFQAVYNGTMALLDSLSFALRAELKDSGVTVTCLMPGATETEFFERADMIDTKVGQSKKDDPADVARTGIDATRMWSPAG
jgi:short-subunit dehydrogenase